jgi:AcrR family transcriptional regulator
MHDVDALLDAAVTLTADAGPKAVTMSAVARAVGAPSGSVYHRFADHPTLLAAVWLRTVRRFQDGFLTALDHGPTDAAEYVVRWSRDNPGEATVLGYGARDFGRERWPKAARAELTRANSRLERAIRACAKRLEIPMDRVLLAVVDLPYAVVRRHLAANRRVPAAAVDLVREAVDTLLAQR